MTKIHNPYWDEVKQYVSKQTHPTWNTYTIGSVLEMAADTESPLDSIRGFLLRKDVVRKYAWTVTSPDTVKFVADHCTGRVADPLAGTGYWEYLLNQYGIPVQSTDADPPELGMLDNDWHQDVSTFVPVRQAVAKDATALMVPGDTLLLSWPPMWSDAGFSAVSNFRGDRLIYIGEYEGGNCGDEALFKLLKAEWEVIGGHAPVQFEGMHDVVIVLDRNRS